MNVFPKLLADEVDDENLKPFIDKLFIASSI